MSLAGTTRYMASEVMATGRYNLKADVSHFKPYVVCFSGFLPFADATFYLLFHRSIVSLWLSMRCLRRRSPFLLSNMTLSMNSYADGSSVLL